MIPSELQFLERYLPDFRVPPPSLAELGGRPFSPSAERLGLLTDVFGQINGDPPSHDVLREWLDIETGDDDWAAARNMTMELGLLADLGVEPFSKSLRSWLWNARAADWSNLPAHLHYVIPVCNEFRHSVSESSWYETWEALSASRRESLRLIGERVASDSHEFNEWEFIADEKAEHRYSIFSSMLAVNKVVQFPRPTAAVRERRQRELLVSMYGADEAAQILEEMSRTRRADDRDEPE